jgi:hypothetical protein
MQENALRCRRAWHRLGVAGRADLAARLSGGDAWDRAWSAVLRGEHPLAAWLDGDDAVQSLPADASPSPRQLLSSHPFRVERPWSSPSPSDESSSTRRG